MNYFFKVERRKGMRANVKISLTITRSTINLLSTFGGKTLADVKRAIIEMIFRDPLCGRCLRDFKRDEELQVLDLYLCLDSYRYKRLISFIRRLGYDKQDPEQLFCRYLDDKLKVALL